MARTRRRNALITGASSGLGAGMAREFARRGLDVALVARRVDRLEEVRRDILAESPSVRVALRQLDVTRHPDVFTVFRELDAEFDGLDRVVVNAGLGKGQPLGTGRFDANLETLETNVLGAWAQAEAALELMRPRDAGHLVLISSVSAVRGMRGNLTTYAATKAAVASLGEGLRLDLADTGVRVTTIMPGPIESEMTARAKRLPFTADADAGARALADAIEREPGTAYVPGRPWSVFARLLKVLPESAVARLT